MLANVKEDAHDEEIQFAREVYNFHSVSNFSFHYMQTNAQRFGGDLASYLIYAAFLVASSSDTLRSLSRERGREYVNSELSIQSISKMTGIPRETVRRKCLELVEQGHLESLGLGKFRALNADAEVAPMVGSFLGMARLLR